MRILSMRSSTLKFSLVLLISVLAISSLMIFVPASNEELVATKISYSDINSSDDMLAFISRFGWKVEQTPVEEVEIVIPNEFDGAFSDYNEIQRAQGLDLEKYRGEKAVKFTYKVTNYEDFDGTVHINLIVLNNKIIGGDVCSADPNGFIYGFSGKSA